MTDLLLLHLLGGDVEPLHGLLGRGEPALPVQGFPLVRSVVVRPVVLFPSPAPLAVARLSVVEVEPVAGLSEGSEASSSIKHGGLAEVRPVSLRYSSFSACR